jgi:hypothetical protein
MKEDGTERKGRVKKEHKKETKVLHLPSTTPNSEVYFELHLSCIQETNKEMLWSF